MAKASISKTVVDGALAGEKDYFLWDKNLAGFGLKVTPSGGKVYVFQYRIAKPGFAQSTPAKRYTIGKHGALTPDQARSRAKELAAMVALGIDPKEEEKAALLRSEAEKEAAALRAKRGNELAFSRVSKAWLNHYENEKGRRPSSVKLARTVVSNYLVPALGDTPVPDVSRADLQSIIDAIPAKKKAMRRAVYSYASVVFGWMQRRDYVAANPLLLIEKPEAPKSRDRVLSDSELAAVWFASRDLTAPFNSFFRLLVITTQRRGEVAAMNWTELDRDAALWLIPPDRAKNDKPHLVPLSSLAITELDALAGGTEWPKSGYVLSTNGRSPVSGFSKAKKALDEKVAAYVQLPDWRVHDLRRTGATILQRLGVRFEVTEAVLNHISGSKGGVAGVYQRHDWKEEKRAALDSYAAFLSALPKPEKERAA